MGFLFRGPAPVRWSPVMAHYDGTIDWSCSAARGSALSSFVSRVKAGEPEAWRRLVELYEPTVYRWCRQCGLAADDAADVCREVFSSLAARIGQFRHEKPGDSFRGWLWTIAQGKVQDYFRRRDGPAAVAPDVAQPPADAALLHRVMNCVRGEVEPASWQALGA